MSGDFDDGYYNIIIGGPWRIYTVTVPQAWTMIGTIQRGADSGALALSPAGIYAQINAGVIRRLDHRKCLV